MDGGYCIAGKEVMEDGSIGEWIRPVSTEKERQIDKSKIERLLKLSGERNLLVKYLKISFLEHVPHDEHQIENHLIDSSKNWELLDSSSIKNKPSLIKIIDEPNVLWHIYNSTSDNDTIPEKSMEGINSSLLLIRIKEKILLKYVKGKIRAHFLYNNNNYQIRNTDIHLEDNYQNNDTLPENTLLCVSLPSVFKDGNVYKLVAGVITPDMYRGILL